jgi:hypothetical protein
MQIKVTVKVETNSGAVISLTDPQAYLAAKYIEEMVFGETKVREKRAPVKKSARRTWTKEEDDLIVDGLALPQGKPRSKAYRAIARTYKRSLGSISQRGCVLKRREKKTGYQPLEVFSTGLLGR